MRIHIHDDGDNAYFGSLNIPSMTLAEIDRRLNQLEAPTTAQVDSFVVDYKYTPEQIALVLQHRHIEVIKDIFQDLKNRCYDNPLVRAKRTVDRLRIVLGLLVEEKCSACNGTGRQLVLPPSSK